MNKISYMSCLKVLRLIYLGHSYDLL
jgi:hypothetical protein